MDGARVLHSLWDRAVVVEIPALVGCAHVRDIVTARTSTYVNNDGTETVRRPCGHGEEHGVADVTVCLMHGLSDDVEGETFERNHKDGRPVEDLRCFGASTACVASGAGEVGVEMFLTNVIGQEEFKGRVVFIGQTDFLCMCSLVLHRRGVARGAFKADELQVSENLVLRRCGSEGRSIEVGSGHVATQG